MIPLSWYVILSAVLFSIGVVGVLTRRNIFIILISRNRGTVYADEFNILKG